MPPLVLIIYLVLVLAVAGQAVHVQKEAPSKPEKRQIRDVPDRGNSVRDTVLDRTERIHETIEAGTEFTRPETI